MLCSKARHDVAHERNSFDASANQGLSNSMFLCAQERSEECKNLARSEYAGIDESTQTQRTFESLKAIYRSRQSVAA